MIAADPSNPQWVGPALRRRLLPLLSGGAMVRRISGCLFVAAGRAGRSQTLRMPLVASAHYLSAPPCVEDGGS
jgi:hypothetical protein